MDLKRTPLYDFHVANGARMVPFAGWDMPVQYSTGIKAEHLATRNGAGLFDVSHMAQIEISGVGANAFLERLPMSWFAVNSPSRPRHLVSSCFAAFWHPAISALSVGELTPA